MIFKKRTFYGDEPERQDADHPADLERRVAHFLAVAPGLDAADVTVTAKGNTIILAGFVATQAEIVRAEEAAKHLQEVAEVINRIETAGAK